MESGILSSGALLQRQEVRKSQRPGKIKFKDDQDWVDNGVRMGHGVRGTERRQQRFTDSQLVLERDGGANLGPWVAVTSGHAKPGHTRSITGKSPKASTSLTRETNPWQFLRSPPVLLASLLSSSGLLC